MWRLIHRLWGKVSLASHYRRIRIWALAVLVMVASVAFQAAFPQWRFLPGLSASLGHWMFLAVFFAALLCEYIDSSLGMGYGTTLTPLLLLAGFEPLQIIPCVLLSEFLTGLLAALMHHRDGNVDFLRDRKVRTTALLLSALSAVGAIAAVTFAVRIPKLWLTSIIAVIIVSVGVITLATLRRRFAYRPSHMLALGAVAAFNKGLSGGGYGPLLTAGQVVSGMSPKQAVAITSLAESFTCFVGLVAFLVLQGSHIDWTLAMPLSTGAILSVPVATLTVRRLPENVMRACVGGATCLLGLLALAKVML